MKKKLYEELLDIDFDEFDEIIASQDVYTDGSSHSEVTAKKDDDDLDDDLDITIDDEELDDLLSDVDDTEVDTNEFADDGYLDVQPAEDEEIVDCNIQDIKESSKKNIRANFKKAKELNESRKSHSNISKILKEGFYAPNVEFISNGAWSDPQLLYKDKYFNYWDIEDAMWYDFVDEFYGGDSIKAEKDPKSEDAYRDWLNADDKVANYLDDAIFGGYDYYDENGNVRRESKKIKESSKNTKKSIMQIYENKKKKTKNRIVESLLVDNVVDDIERTLKSTLDAHGISAAERATILGLILDRMLHASDEEIEAPEYIETVITDVVEDDTIADIVKDAVESALDGETEPREETIKVETTVETPEGEITITKEEGKEAEEEK